MIGSCLNGFYTKYTIRAIIQPHILSRKFLLLVSCQASNKKWLPQFLGYYNLLFLYWYWLDILQQINCISLLSTPALSIKWIPQGVECPVLDLILVPGSSPSWSSIGWWQKLAWAGLTKANSNVPTQRGPFSTLFRAGQTEGWRGGGWLSP